MKLFDTWIYTFFYEYLYHMDYTKNLEIWLATYGDSTTMKVSVKYEAIWMVHDDILIMFYFILIIFYILFYYFKLY